MGAENINTYFGFLQPEYYSQYLFVLKNVITFVLGNKQYAMQITK